MRYGPQTAYIEVLIERARQLTADELQNLAVAWYGADQALGNGGAAAVRAALEAWRGPTGDAKDGEAIVATVLGIASQTTNIVADLVEAVEKAGAVFLTEGVGTFAATAAGDAVIALAARHLVGTCGLTYDHYRILTTPWAMVVDLAHPDDQEIR